jgi:hypothetical protein
LDYLLWYGCIDHIHAREALYPQFLWAALTRGPIHLLGGRTMVITVRPCSWLGTDKVRETALRGRDYSNYQKFCPICRNETVTPDSDPGSRFRIPALASDLCPKRAGMTSRRLAQQTAGFSISSFEADIFPATAVTLIRQLADMFLHFGISVYFSTMWSG